MNDFDVIKDFVEDELAQLCDKLELDPVQLDVFLFDSDNPPAKYRGQPAYQGHAQYGIGKEGPQIVLPVDASEKPLSGKGSAFPPSDWNHMDNNIWPEWRRDLWHEVCHHVSKTLGEYDPNEQPERRGFSYGSGKGHGRGWDRAVRHMAAKFQTSPEEMGRMLNGPSHIRKPQDAYPDIDIDL